MPIDTRRLLASKQTNDRRLKTWEATPLGRNASAAPRGQRGSGQRRRSLNDRRAARCRRGESGRRGRGVRFGAARDRRPDNDRGRLDYRRRRLQLGEQAAHIAVVAVRPRLARVLRAVMAIDQRTGAALRIGATRRLVMAEKAVVFLGSDAARVVPEADQSVEPVPHRRQQGVPRRQRSRHHPQSELAIIQASRHGRHSGDPLGGGPATDTGSTIHLR